VSLSVDESELVVVCYSIMLMLHL